MEFFEEIESPGLDIEALQALLTISNLPDLCDAIDTVFTEQGNEGEIYSIWGRFHIRREEIRCGIRFSLSNCPHALAWTITYHEADNRIVIHCTIDKREQDEDFVESIEVFVADWRQGLSIALSPPEEAACSTAS